MKGSIQFTPGEVSAYYAARVPYLKQRSGVEWRGACPIHCGKHHNFAVKSGTGRWRCYSQCGLGGDIIDLEIQLIGGNFRSALASVCSVIGRPNDWFPAMSSYECQIAGEKVRQDQADLALAYLWRSQSLLSLGAHLDSAKQALEDACDEAVDAAGESVGQLSDAVERLRGLSGESLLRVFREALKDDRLRATGAVREAIEDQQDAERVASLCVILLVAPSSVRRNAA